MSLEGSLGHSIYLQGKELSLMLTKHSWKAQDCSASHGRVVIPTGYHSQFGITAWLRLNPGVGANSDIRVM